MTETEARARCPMLVTRPSGRGTRRVGASRAARGRAGRFAADRGRRSGARVRRYGRPRAAHRRSRDDRTTSRASGASHRADPAHRARGEPYRRADGGGRRDREPVTVIPPDTSARCSRRFPSPRSILLRISRRRSAGGECGRSASWPRCLAKAWPRVSGPPGSALTIWRSVSTAIRSVRGRRRRSGKKRRGSSGRSTRSASSPGVLETVLERLCRRLAAVSLVADSLEIRLGLASGGHHARDVSLAYPMSEVKPMLTLAVLDLEAHPPPARRDARRDQRPSDPYSRRGREGSGSRPRLRLAISSPCSRASRPSSAPTIWDRPCSSIRTAPMPSRCSRSRRRAMPQRPVAAAKSLAPRSWAAARAAQDAAGAARGGRDRGRASGARGVAARRRLRGSVASVGRVVGPSRPGRATSGTWCWVTARSAGSPAIDSRATGISTASTTDPCSSSCTRSRRSRSSKAPSIRKRSPPRPRVSTCPRSPWWIATASTARPGWLAPPRQRGVKPIVGSELTLADGSRLPLLVEDREGYQNLCRLITRMKLGAPKDRPSLALDDLEP